ncbi:metal-dependent hydrolase [Candidatus Parcubacteria bacterium]|nr:MAG: metal-dependent hydrolase [Candidatus Parcubacteria bacterium]
MKIRESKKSIDLEGQKYEYTLRRRPRVRYVRLTIEHDGSLVVTAPVTYPVFLIKKFLSSRFKWIYQAVEKVKTNPSIFGFKHSDRQIKEYKKSTRKLVEQRIAHFNQYYNFVFNRIAIRNQSSRWGSCSSSKNLNFNYRICLLPSELADYIIVHELCHLSEMNHSVKFWQLVERTIPEHKKLRKELKKI